MSEPGTGQADQSPLPAPGLHHPPYAHGTETVTLHTDLLGDLVVPAACRIAALQALNQRAAIYCGKYPTANVWAAALLYVPTCSF